MNKNSKTQFPPQHQEGQPGIESKMHPRPEAEKSEYIGSGKLMNKVAVITGGDSGIGRAVAIAFAKEGADVLITYFNEHEDAQETKARVESEGRRCVTLAGDISNESFSHKVVSSAQQEFDHVDILVNNAAIQFPQESLEKISNEQFENTFRVNIFSYFYLTKAFLPILKTHAAIINTTSVTAYRGHKLLIDYSSTKGAIVSFTRSLALSLVERNIRVNAVAPGPIWTPLIPASFTASQVTTFGESTPMQRAGQPSEIAPCYVFLASSDASYITGQVLHPNGGEIVNG